MPEMVLLSHSIVPLLLGDMHVMPHLMLPKNLTHILQLKLIVSSKCFYRRILFNVRLSILLYSIQASDSNILSEPKIAWRMTDFGIENGQLILNCSVNVTSVNRFEMKWDLPNQNIAEKVRIL